MYYVVTTYIILIRSLILTILGEDTIYNDLKVWLFTGVEDFYESKGKSPLREEFEETYFSDLPKNLEKPHIGPLSSK